MKPKRKKCPKCKKLGYVVSIFGSICPHCLYDPKEEINSLILEKPVCCGKCGRPESHNVEHDCPPVEIRKNLTLYLPGGLKDFEWDTIIKKILDMKFIWEQKAREEIRQELLEFGSTLSK